MTTRNLSPQEMFIQLARAHRPECRFAGRDRRAFASLGLRPGDLVTEINGMALNNPAQGMEAFSTLSDATQVTLTLERNGQPVSLSVDVSQLDNQGRARQ